MPELIAVPTRAFIDNAPSLTFPYRIEAKAGEGAMGIVYRAVDIEFGRTVAIKIPRFPSSTNTQTDLTDELRSRFLREARAASNLSHPNIATIYKSGQEWGVPYIVMEWLQGQTLDDILAVEPKLPVSRVATLGVDLLEALDAAHRAGVIHRDIKPSNLIQLDSGPVKITDFGIAKMLDCDLIRTKPGEIVGTPWFIAPEQIEGGPIDGRCDIFSSGIVLYLALAGRLPFDGKTVWKLMNEIAYSDPKPLRSFVPDLPAEIERVIHTALRKDPNDRFGTARQMAEHLRPFTSRETLVIAPGTDQLQTAVEMTSDLATTVSQNATFFFDKGSSRASLIASLVATWPSKPTGRVSADWLLDRLLQIPIHARPFAGGVFFGSICLLVHDGLIVGAVDTETGAVDDAACEAFPSEAEAVLHLVPENLPEDFVPMLASLLHPPRQRFADLHSSLINHEALGRQLASERFDGVVELTHAKAAGYVFLRGGEEIFAAMPKGWTGFLDMHSWPDWAARTHSTIGVESLTWHPMAIACRRRLANHELYVRPATSGTGFLANGKRLIQNLRANAFGATRPGQEMVVRPTVDDVFHQGIYEFDVSYKFFRWALVHLEPFFKERNRENGWKYLVGWMPLIRKAILHHDLPRPSSPDADYFDLVTTDSHEKVLHLAHRTARGSLSAFQEFLDRVIRAKTARIKTGDVGGAILIAPSFDPDAIDAYLEASRPDTTRRRMLGVEERFTGYEGFIRIGPRRGFHLLLVLETPDGFVPLLPGTDGRP